MTDKRAIETVERDVLSVYQAENPSNYQIDRDEAAFAANEARLVGLYRDYLKLPPRMFRDATLLDGGAGTGERTVFYSRWGAHCTLVDMNGEALARARAIFDRFAPSDRQTRFIESSLFDLELPDTYDLVVCDGVLHHTADKAAGFAELARYVRPDGYFVLGIGNRAGFFQSNLQRLVLYHYAKTPETIEALAPRFFAERIERGMRFGGRTERAIIYDSYVNPKIETPLVSEVLRWLNDAGLTLYSTWPSLLPPFLADSTIRASLPAIVSHPLLGAIPELFWMGHTHDDLDALAAYWEAAATLEAAMVPALDAVGDVTPAFSLDVPRFEERIREFDRAIDAAWSANRLLPANVQFRQLFDEIRGILSLMNSGADAEAMAAYLGSCKVLFRGTHGLGMSYFVGYRPQS